MDSLIRPHRSTTYVDAAYCHRQNQKSNKSTFPTTPYIQRLVSLFPISIAVVLLYSASYLYVCVCVCEYVFCL